MSIIGSTYYTPQEKAERVEYLDYLHRDDPLATAEERETQRYTRWCMRLLVNGNFEEFKGYGDLCPSRDDWRRATARKEHGAFVTISLPNTHKEDPDKLFNKLHETKSVQKFIFSAEFYSGEESNLNKHYHVFLYGKQHKGNTIKFFSRFFKIASNFVDVVPTYDAETNSQKIKYIKGDKKDDKKQNVLLDREYRSKNNIKDFYSNYT